jgi:hypothetical protein
VGTPYLLVAEDWGRRLQVDGPNHAKTRIYAPVDPKRASVLNGFRAVVRSRQVYIELVVEALLAICSTCVAS